jgi:hypothetical protein
MGPSLTPTIVPTTSIPTIAPTMTGAVALIELSSVVDEEISEETLSNITQQIVSEYGVDEEDIQIEVDYIVNGTFDIEGEVPTDLEERQLLIETLEDELAELLGLHEGDVDVTVNENGEIVYIINSDSFEDAENLQEILSFDNTTSILNNEVQEVLPEVSITTVGVEEDITTDINIVVDVTDASENLNKATEDITTSLTNLGFETTADTVFITAAPTTLPSLVPSLSPITLIPSARPTITGEVFQIELKGENVTEPLSETELDEIAKDIAEEFNVNENEVDYNLCNQWYIKYYRS